MSKISINDYTFQNANQMYSSTPEGLVDYSIWSRLYDLQNRIPCIVQSYNKEKNTVVVKIAILDTLPERDEDGSYKRQEFAPIEVSIKTAFASGVGITYFPQQYDTGWLVACDKDITNWKTQNVEDLKNPSYTNFSLSKYNNGYFEPDIFRKDRFASVSGEEGSLCIQTTDGETAICINKNGKIHIIAKNGLTIDGNVQVNGDVVANGISLVEHIHSGVSRGSSNTNKPVAS